MCAALRQNRCELRAGNVKWRSTRGEVLPQSSDGLPAIPRRIAEDVLSSLKLRTTGAQLPAWPMPAAPAYDAYVRALGRAHTKAKTEAERVALFEKSRPRSKPIRRRSPSWAVRTSTWPDGRAGPRRTTIARKGENGAGLAGFAAPGSSRAGLAGFA